MFPLAAVWTPWLGEDRTSACSRGGPGLRRRWLLLLLRGGGEAYLACVPAGALRRAGSGVRVLAAACWVYPPPLAQLAPGERYR